VGLEVQELRENCILRKEAVEREERLNIFDL
jgi:hypothetical protein